MVVKFNLSASTMKISSNVHQEQHSHLLYSLVVFICSLFFVFVVGELLVRILIPKEFYLPINNIYQAVNAEHKFILKPNLNVTAFGVPLRTNSLGFRGPEWSLHKNDNTVRIALLGDSHAFGYGVSFKDTVGEKLAKLLTDQNGKKYEVFNFGVVGYNSFQELAVLKSVVLKFKPDIIIVIPCSNDHKDSFYADHDGFLRTTKNVDVNDESINKLKIKTSSWLVGNSRLIFYLLFMKKQYDLCRDNNELREPDDEAREDRRSWWMGPFDPLPVPQQLQKAVFEPLQGMVIEAKKNNIPIIIANFNAIPAYRQLFAQLAQDEKIPSLELLALFPEVNSWKELLQRYGLGWNNHLNANAHERWARALSEIVTNMNK